MLFFGVRPISLAILCAMAFGPIAAWSYDPKNPVVTGHDLPAEAVGVGVEEHLGSTLDLGLEFTADSGETVTLGKYFGGTRPVLMAMVYYTCPSLCNHHLNAITEALKNLKWSAGKEFEIVAVSMNHREGPEVARAKKENYIKAYGRTGAPGNEGWHFLTGSEENVNRLAEQLGFKFKWIPEKEEYSHAAVAYVLTPKGTISRYLFGLGVDTNTLRLSLIEASNGKVGTIVDQLLMFCFQFDPTKSKYTLYAWNVMRLGAGLIMVVLALVLVPVWLRERKKSNQIA